MNCNVYDAGGSWVRTDGELGLDDGLQHLEAVQRTEGALRA